MPPPAASGGQQQDSSYSALWMTLGLFLLCGVVWYYFHAQIVTFLFRVKLMEIKLLSPIVPRLHAVAQIIQDTSASSVSFQQLSMVSEAVGRYLRYPLGLLMGGLTVWMYFSNPITRFHRTHSMKTLLASEKGNWPQIMPVSNLDLVKEHVEKGRWAIAMNPLQFCKRFDLLLEELDPSIYDPRIKRTATLIREKAETVFSVHMGAPFRGVEHMPIHLQALFAAFAAKANEDRDSTEKLFDQIALSAATGKLDFSGVRPILRKHMKLKAVRRAMGSHAYELTLMASMLQLARTDGVLASADFLWLKPLDRRTWFMLNAVGRQTSVPEVAGAFAHWKTELLFGRPLPIPMVKTAVDALDEELESVIYKPEETDE